MKNIILFISILFTIISCATPKVQNAHFEGKFVYKISLPNGIDEVSDSTDYQVVYAKDSMLRIENNTPIGKQIYIKHIPRNRAYILMDFGATKLAIQTIPDTASENSNYHYSSLKGGEKIAGFKTQSIAVHDIEMDTTITMNYYPNISSKYSTAYTRMPGLPMKYYLLSDNEWVKYQIQSIEEKVLDINLFGIPSDYQIITFDEFIELLQQEEE